MTDVTKPTKCQLDASKALLDFYNSHTQSSRIISDYCHGKLPLPCPHLLQYIQHYNTEIITGNSEIDELLKQTINLSQKFYELLEEASTLPRGKYTKMFEAQIQSYGQLLIDHLYLTRQHLKTIRIKHPDIRFTTPEYDTTNIRVKYSVLWKIAPMRKLYATMSLWAFRNHNKILTVYYSIMVIAIALSWYLGFITLGHIGYQSNLALFTSAITAIVTMLAFLGFHPVVDFNNYDIDGRNLLANTYRKYMVSWNKSKDAWKQPAVP